MPAVPCAPAMTVSSDKETMSTQENKHMSESRVVYLVVLSCFLLVCCCGGVIGTIFGALVW